MHAQRKGEVKKVKTTQQLRDEFEGAYLEEQNALLKQIREVRA